MNIPAAVFYTMALLVLQIMLTLFLMIANIAADSVAAR